MLVAFGLLALCWKAVVTTDVFSDVHGRCSRRTPFQLSSDETFLVQSQDWSHDTEALDCRLPFQAQPGNGVCLTFVRFSVQDCGLSLLLYEGFGVDGRRVWKQYGCHDNKPPSTLCTTDRKLTIRIVKANQTGSVDYAIEIRVRENPNSPASDVTALPLGVILGIVIAVLVVVLLLVALVVCCCCRQVSGGAKKTDRLLPFRTPSKPHYTSTSLPASQGTR